MWACGYDFKVKFQKITFFIFTKKSRIFHFLLKILKNRNRFFSAVRRILNFFTKFYLIRKTSNCFFSDDHFSPWKMFAASAWENTKNHFFKTEKNHTFLKNNLKSWPRPVLFIFYLKKFENHLSWLSGCHSS